MGISRKIISWLGVAGLALMLLAGVLILSPTTGALASDPGEGWLGVSLQELTPRLRDAMDLDPDTRGVVVAAVFRGSPADAAGLREGDVIIELDDQRVRSVDEAVDLVQGLEPGKKVLLVVMRNGEQRGLGATLGTRDERGQAYFVPKADNEVREHYEDDPRNDSRRAPRANDQWEDKSEEDAEEPENSWQSKDGDVFIYRDQDRAHERHRDRIHVAPRIHMRGGASGGYLGVRTMPLGEQLSEYFGIDEGAGVLVTEVVEDSPAAEAGLMAGDVIVAVGDADVESPADLRKLVRKYDPEDSVEITVLRKGSRRTLNATLGDAQDFGSVLFLGPDDRMVAIPDIPRIPEIEIIMPHIESLERLHLDLEELEGLKGIEIIELESLPHIEIILENHRDSLKHLRKSMRHLHHNLREVERDRRVRTMEARERVRKQQRRVEEVRRTEKAV